MKTHRSFKGLLKSDESDDSDASVEKAPAKVKAVSAMEEK